MQDVLGGGVTSRILETTWLDLSIWTKSNLCLWLSCSLCIIRKSLVIILLNVKFGTLSSRGHRCKCLFPKFGTLLRHQELHSPVEWHPRALGKMTMSPSTWHNVAGSHLQIGKGFKTIIKNGAQVVIVATGANMSPKMGKGPCCTFNGLSSPTVWACEF